MRDDEAKNKREKRKKKQETKKPKNTKNIFQVTCGPVGRYAYCRVHSPYVQVL